MPSAIWVIVTLPTSDDLVDLAGVDAAPPRRPRRRAARASRARAPAACRAPSSSIIVAETREITSAPYGCWRLSIERTAAGVPVSRSSSVATTVVVPRSNAIAKRRAGGVARLDVDQHVVAHHRGDVEVRLAQHACRACAAPARLDPRLEVVDRGEHALDVGALVLQRRLLEHEVALLHGRAQDHVAADADQRRLRPRLQRRHARSRGRSRAVARQASRQPSRSSSG